MGWGSTGALIGVAVLQISALLAWDGEGTAAPTVEEGFSFADVRVSGEDGVDVSLASGAGPTLVLVFHSECAHCERVAPTWKEWLENAPAGLRVIAVSSEPLGVAKAYAARHGWRAHVGSVESAEVGSPGHFLTRRTPWVFGLDPDGRVVVGEHGSEVARVASDLLGG